MFFMVIGVLGVFMFGCSSDDDELPEVENSVVGTWELREVTLEGSGSADVALSPIPIPVTFSGTGADYDMQLVFSEDPQDVIAFGSFNVEVDVSAVGINLGKRTFPIIGSEAFRENWSQENGELILIGSETEVRFRISEVTPSRLVFEGNPDLRDFGFEEGGIRLDEASFRFVFDR